MSGALIALTVLLGILAVIACLFLVGLYCALKVQPTPPRYAERTTVRPPYRALLWLFAAACAVLAVGYFSGWSLP